MENSTWDKCEFRQTASKEAPVCKITGAECQYSDDEYCEAYQEEMTSYN